MAEPRSTKEIAELRSQVQALAERSRKSGAANQSKRLAVIEVVLVFMIVYFAWDYNSRFRPFEITGAVFSGRTDIQEETVNEDVKLNDLERAIFGQLAAAENEITLLRQEFYRLHKRSDAFLNTLIKEWNDEITLTSLEQNITVLQHQIDQLRWTLTREFKHQLKVEAVAISRTAVLRQEVVDLLRDKQSKMASRLESALTKQAIDRLENNEAALREDVELLKNKPARNLSLHEFTELSHLLQQEFNRLKENEQVQILEREFEKMKLQLKQTQDEAFTAAAALRQEFIELLRDKQSKTAFRLESTLIKQEMNRLKQNEEALKQEIELFKNKSAGNCSLQEVKDLLEQEFGQYKESEQVLEREFEKMKQQEAFTAAAALRQELVELLRDKQSKIAFRLETALMKQEMDRLKQNQEALKKEIDQMQTNWTLSTETMQLSQKLDNLIEKHMNTTTVIKEHEEQITQLAEKQESARERFLRDITQPRERQEQIRKVRLEIDQLKHNEVVFQRKIEIMKQEYESKAMSGSQEMEELRHETQALRKDAEQNQLIQNLSNFCSQSSSSTTKECRTELSKELLWELAALMALAIICYLTFSLYHQKYQSKIDAESRRIDQLTKKLETDQRNTDAQTGKLDAESQRMDQLTKKQKADREQLAQEIDAQRITLGLTREKVYRFIEEQETSRKHLVRNIDALRLRQEHIRTVLAEQHLPALLPFQITMPNFFKHKSAGDVWYSQPFYTDPRGYKMCLAVHADGARVDEGRYVSIFIYLMRGEFDDELMWPFRGKVTMYLLNQFEARGHREITFNSEGNDNRAIEGERASIGIGEECVVSYRDLSHMYDTHTQYLKYDSLRFRVSDVELKQDTVPVIPTDIIMTDFEGRKKDSEQWFSEPFYANPEGYKMCLRVDPNGSDDGRGTHVSVYVTLMQGEHDDRLKWPFRGDITIKLLNQETDAGHWEKTLPFDDTAGHDVAGRVIEWRGRARKGWGIHKFIAHAKLSTKGSEHVRNNCLHFQVVRVVVKSR